MYGDHEVYATVQMHGEMGRDAHPAVNIKVQLGPDSVTLPLDLGGVADADGSNHREIYTEPEFTLEWVEKHLSEDEQHSWWETTCQDGFGQAVELAKETFGPGIEVYTEGRSAGWLVVYGLGDPEEWDADQVARWVQFQSEVKAMVDDIPRGYLWNIHANVFEHWETEQFNMQVNYKDVRESLALILADTDMVPEVILTSLDDAIANNAGDD